MIWQEETERPGKSPLNNEKRSGKFIAKVCGLEVFSSEHKYDSGTGWQSFYEANKENLVLKEGYTHGWGSNVLKWNPSVESIWGTFLKMALNQPA